MSLDSLSSRFSTRSFGSDLASHGSQDGSRDRGGVSGEGKHSMPHLRRPRPWPSGAQPSASGRDSGGRIRSSVGTAADHHRKQEVVLQSGMSKTSRPSNRQNLGGGGGDCRPTKEGAGRRLLGRDRSSSSFGGGQEEEEENGLSTAGVGPGLEAVEFAGVDARRSIPDTILGILVRA